MHNIHIYICTYMYIHTSHHKEAARKERYQNISNSSIKFLLVFLILFFFFLFLFFLFLRLSALLFLPLRHLSGRFLLLYHYTGIFTLIRYSPIFSNECNSTLF